MGNASITPLALGLALLSLSAHAARPLATDDAGVLAKGDCEWESFVARQAARSDGSHAWNTLGTCGTHGGLQLALAYGQTRDSGPASSSLSAGVKRALVDGGETDTAVTLAAGLYSLRAGGPSHRLDSAVLSLIGSRPLGSGVTAHANLGWLHRRPTGRASTTWNLAVEHAGPARIDWVGEVYGDDRSRQPWLGAGLRWATTPRLNLNAAWTRRGGADAARLVSLGFKLAF